MSLFSKHATGSLGVDIGGSGMKVAELGLVKSRPVLHTYGYAEYPTEGFSDNPLDDPQRLGHLLAKLHKESGCKSTSAMAALPLSQVFTTIVAVPRTRDAKLMKEQIDVQAGKLAPMPIKEMITYSTVIDAEGKKGSETENITAGQSKGGAKDYARVLVTGAAKSLVQTYVQIFKTAKLELQAIDTESFALIRSLIGKDRGTILLLDFGAKKTNLTIVEKGIPFLTRSMSIGGDALTKQLMQKMNMKREDAEEMKRGFTRVDDGVRALLEPFIQPIVHEIRYATQLFANMEFTESTHVEKMVVTGGSSQLPELARLLSAALNMNVYLGDPFARLLYPEGLRDVLDEIGPRMSVAIGLAMRETVAK